MKRLILSFLGINIMALALNGIISFDVGVGPFDSMTQVFQIVFSIEKFGNASFLLHFLFAIFLVLLSFKFNIDKKSILISIGTIFITSRIINFYSWIIPYENIQFTYINFIIFFMILNFGLYLIASTNLVIAPYDKTVVEISNWLIQDLGKVRLYTDMSLLMLVVLAKIVLKIKVSITIGTLFISFATGLNIMLYENIIVKVTKKVKKNL